MGDTVIRKKENTKQRVTGANVPPVLTQVAGTGSQYDQSWKVDRGPNWIDRSQKVATTHAFDEAFFHRTGKHKG